MATLVHDNPEIAHRLHDFEAQTHRDKTRFASGVIGLIFLVVLALIYGLAQAGW